MTAFLLTWTEIGRRILDGIDSDASQRLLNRLSLLADAAILPEGMTVNIPALGMLLGLGESGTRKLVKRNAVPEYQPGEQLMYRTDDVVRCNIKTASADAPALHQNPPKRKNTKKQG